MERTINVILKRIMLHIGEKIETVRKNYLERRLSDMEKGRRYFEEVKSLICEDIMKNVLVMD